MSKSKPLCALLIAAVLVPYLALHKSDSYLRNRAVKLKSPHGSCSGEQVHLKSGADYILTAGHCAALKAADGSITVELENGKEIQRQVIAEDMKSDLLLIQGVPGLRGIDIAAATFPGQEVRTFTHGSGLKTYKTSGELIQEQDVMMMAGEGACPIEAPKYKSMNIEVLPGLSFDVCILAVREVVTSAMVVPGSSGGMVVDSSGDLVGVVSGGDTKFGLLVTIQDINAFLAGY